MLSGSFGTLSTFNRKLYIKILVGVMDTPINNVDNDNQRKHFPLVGLDLVDGVDVYELDLELDISIYLEKLDGYEAYLYLFFFFIF